MKKFKINVNHDIKSRDEIEKLKSYESEKEIKKEDKQKEAPKSTGGKTNKNGGKKEGEGDKRRKTTGNKKEVPVQPD